MTATLHSPSQLLTDAEFRDVVQQYRRENWKGIQTPEWQACIVEQILQDDGEDIFRQLAPLWKVPEDATVLDIGSGLGAFVMACHRRGLSAFGIEPDRIGQGGSLTSIEIANRRTDRHVFACALGEQLPFPDNSFDFIAMNQVMEHVSNQKLVLSEAARVLRPGGVIYLASPNYLRFYESHYKVWWFPLLPKIAGRLYLRVRGRNPVLLEQLTYTTNARLSRLVQTLGSGYTLIDCNRERLIRKWQGDSFASAKARLVSKAVRLGVIGSLIRAAVLWFLRCREGGSEMLVTREG